MKLGWFMSEADELGKAVFNARAKIVVFIAVIMISVTVAGTLMYEVENRSFIAASGRRMNPAQVQLVADVRQQLNAAELTVQDLLPVEQSKFTSIPESIYWATVTMTTVGYGDIVPMTVGGKVIATMLIVLGYSLIIVPTGFVSAEFMKERSRISNRACPHCLTENHAAHARFCQDCGGRLSLSDFQE
jgi:voltage-gated potassium channel